MLSVTVIEILASTRVNDSEGSGCQGPIFELELHFSSRFHLYVHSTSTQTHTQTQ